MRIVRASVEALTIFVLVLEWNMKQVLIAKIKQRIDNIKYRSSSSIVDLELGLDTRKLVQHYRELIVWAKVWL